MKHAITCYRQETFDIIMQRECSNKVCDLNPKNIYEGSMALSMNERIAGT